MREAVNINYNAAIISKLRKYGEGSSTFKSLDSTIELRSSQFLFGERNDFTQIDCWVHKLLEVPCFHKVTVIYGDANVPQEGYNK